MPKTHFEKHSAAEKRSWEYLNVLIRLFNAQDYNGVIKQFEENEQKKVNYWHSDTRKAAWIFASLSKAIINNDYEIALSIIVGYDNNNFSIEYRNEKHLELALNVGKKLWANKNGREMTDSDFTQYRISHYERIINDEVNRKKGVGNLINIWEKLTGRKMTKEDKIRITGKVFNTKGSSSLSIDLHNDFISSFFGFVCGAGVLLTSLWILILLTGEIASGLLLLGLLAIGIISAIIAGKAWRNKKNVRFIIMLVIGIIGWFSLFGIFPNSLKSIFNNAQEARTATEQTIE